MCLYVNIRDLIWESEIIPYSKLLSIMNDTS